MYDFISLDFETANSNMNSACALGLSFVKDCKIVDNQYYLIHPPTLRFNPTNIEIHGITENDVKDAPKFPDIWKQINQYFNGDYLIVAHNAKYDMNVLKKCLITYELKYPEFEYADSMEIAKVDNLSSSLASLTKHYGISLENHHNAQEDSDACALITLAAMKLTSYNSFNAFFRCSRFKSYLFSDLGSKSKKKSSQNNDKYKNLNIDINEIAPVFNTIDSNHPFHSKTFVFTGELNQYSRKEAMQLVVNYGGILKSGITQTTDYLVVGQQDTNLTKASTSSKERKAADLVERGFPITVLHEKDFLNLLQDKILEKGEIL